MKRFNKKVLIVVVCVVIALAAAAAYGYNYYLEYEAGLEAEREAQRVAMEEEAIRVAALEIEKARLAAERLKEVTIKAKRPTMEVERPAPPPPEPRQNILDWKELNPDTIGFLQIENTKVAYPVVQGTDNIYYLNYTFDHIKATRGSIFLDATVQYNPLELPVHFLIHGHHMKDGSMFHNVALYKGKKFFEEHPYIRLETLFYDTVWQVFSVYVCGSNEYVPPRFKSDEAFMAYLQKTADRSMFPVEMEFSPDDRIMTLNTCSYEFNDAHTLVVAKLIEIIEE